MLPSVAEAEDVVQEAYVRYERALADGATVESPKAYLSAGVTRLALDELRSARRRRETYSGEWLPEPLLTADRTVDPALAAEQSDSLSLGFLLLLERLGPVERAVFLLHDVFGYEHHEIAEIVAKREENCRQIARRARSRVEAGRPRFEASREKRRDWPSGSSPRSPTATSTASWSCSRRTPSSMATAAVRRRSGRGRSPAPTASPCCSPASAAGSTSSAAAFSCTR